MVRKFHNHIYDDNAEMNKIIDAFQPESDDQNSKLLRMFLNTFALTADIRGIERYERFLKIIPNPPSESTEFRRWRVINKMSILPPYTKLFLQDKLNFVFGPNNWRLVIEHDIYTLYIMIKTDLDNMYDETMKEIRQTIPANIIIFTGKLIEHPPAEESVMYAITAIQPWIRIITHVT